MVVRRCAGVIPRYEYIKELDKQRGRGQQGAKSPLLWDAGQMEELLQGSPVAKEVGLRLKVRRLRLALSSRVASRADACCWLPLCSCNCDQPPSVWAVYFARSSLQYESSSIVILVIRTLEQFARSPGRPASMRRRC